MSNHLMSIEAVALASVTGGTGVTKASGSNSNDTALSGQLTGLSDSIKELAKPQANTNSSSTMLMFVMAMALSRPAASPSVVYVGGRRGWW